MEVIGVGALDFDRDDVARPQRAARGDMDDAVDLRRLALGAALAAFRAAGVDDRLDAPADLGGEALGADRLLARHETLPARLLLFVRDLRQAEIVGGGAGDGLVFEGADAAELSFVQPVEQESEILLALAGKADNERGADGQIRADCPPRPDPLQGLFLIAGPAHGPEHGRRGVLEGHVDIGRTLPSAISATTSS